MKVTGIEIFLESHHVKEGPRIQRLGVVPLQISDTRDFDHLQLRVQFKPVTGGVEEFFVDLNHLRRL